MGDHRKVDTAKERTRTTDVDVESSDESDLLELLADAREDAERFRSRLRSAESAAEDAASAAEALRSEIDGMTSSLVELDRQLDAANARLREALLEIDRLEALQLLPKGTEAEADHDRAIQMALRAQLEEMRRSTSWKVTAPMRFVARSVSRDQTRH
jgi:chromosome segregation ATPase